MRTIIETYLQMKTTKSNRGHFKVAIGNIGLIKGLIDIVITTIDTIKIFLLISSSIMLLQAFTNVSIDVPFF